MICIPNRKKGFFLLSLILISYYAHSQTIYHHNLFWGRIVLSDNISKKLKWEFYLQKRTQNDPDHTYNIFKHDQLTSYWLWLHYQLTKDLRVSISPFCYFDTKALIPAPAELGDRGVKEFRWAVQLEQTSRYKYFNFSNRYSLEYRYRDLFEEGIYIPNYRARYRARLEKQIKKDWLHDKYLSLIFYDEIFFEFGRAIHGSPAIFNQNRIYAGFNYEVIKNVKFNLGYMYVIQERATGKAFDNSNVVWAILSFENLFSQFKKKKELEPLSK